MFSSEMMTYIFIYTVFMEVDRRGLDLKGLHLIFIGSRYHNTHLYSKSIIRLISFTNKFPYLYPTDIDILLFNLQLTLIGTSSPHVFSFHNISFLVFVPSEIFYDGGGSDLSIKHSSIVRLARGRW